MSLSCQHSLFDLPEDVHYLNCGYKGPFLRDVVRKGYEAMQRQLHPYTYTAKDFFEPAEEIKRLFATLIHCNNPARVVLIPSASYGISTVTQNVELTPAQNVILAVDQFPSNVYPWVRLCQRYGAELRMISRPAEGRWSVALQSAIDENTAVVSIGNVHWADGTHFDLQSISETIHNIGGLMIVDGTQSVGALPFDLEVIKPDALICAAYKWLLGPYSTGVAYYGEYFDDKIPLEETWMNRLKSDDFKNLINYQEAYRPFAHRFSVGEFSNFTLLPMLYVALTQVLSWGVDAIQNYTTALATPYINQLRESGFRVTADQERVGHLFGIGIREDIPIDLLQAKLQEANVYASLRGQNIRISTHVFNREEDFSALVDVLKSF